MTRRGFLGGVCRHGAALAGGGLILAMGGCKGTDAVEPVADTLARVKRTHKAMGGLPDNPVAVAQTNKPILYPDIGDPTRYDRQHNPCYPLVEEALMLLNAENPEQPLGNIVRPGDTVVIKPNWCTQYIFPVPITHPSVVHAVAELAAAAGAAKVRIVEAPMTMTHAATWFYGPTYLNVKPWIEHLARKYPKTTFEHQDGNADRFTWVFMGESSLLKDKPREALYHDFGPVVDDLFYDVPDSHGKDPRGYKIGMYAVANGYLDCDVFINFPKMKTHQWTGLTIALKNMMGLNLISTVHRMPKDRAQQHMTSGDWVTHREGGMRDVPHFDGTRFAPAERYKGATTNDVLWRSLCDLYAILAYCDSAGKLQPTKQRRLLNIVDGIIGTEGNGPIIDRRVHSRTIVAGADPVRVDAVCSRIMGWDPKAMMLIRCAAEHTGPTAVGQLGDYEKAVVCAGNPGGMPRVARYAPPQVWAADEKVGIWHS